MSLHRRVSAGVMAGVEEVKGAHIMRVDSILSSARAWLVGALAVSAAGLSQAGNVYWSVDIDVPVDRHGRVGTVVSNVPGGVHRGGSTVVVAPAPVVVHAPPRRAYRGQQVVYVPVVVPAKHAHGRPAWAGQGHRKVVHHHVKHRWYDRDDDRWHHRGRDGDRDDRRGRWDDRDDRDHRGHR